MECRSAKQQYFFVLLLSVFSTLQANPAFIWVLDSFHVGPLVDLKGKNFFFGKHITFLHFLLQISDTGQGIIAVIVGILYKPGSPVEWSK